MVDSVDAGRLAEILGWIGPDIVGIDRLSSSTPRLIAVSAGETDAVGVWAASPDGIHLGPWARLRALARVARGHPRAHIVRRPFWKLHVCVPETHLEPLRDALAAAGAGRSARYAAASFAVPGVSTFLPLEGAKPYLGHVGTRMTVQEYRLEMLVPDWRRGPVEDALRQAHPYEEPAFDWVRLGNRVEVPCLWAEGDEWWAVSVDQAVARIAAQARPRVVHAEKVGWDAELLLYRAGVQVDRCGPGGLLLGGLAQLWEEKRDPF